jgi:diguanylate cyclase
MLSFRNRLLILLLGLVAVAQTVTLFTALARTAATERQQADAQLVSGAQVARRMIDYRERQLANAVVVLTSDFGLREAIAGADRLTVASALGNHAGRVGADLTVALRLDGEVLAYGEGTQSVDAAISEQLKQSVESQSGDAHFIITDDRVFQVFTAPVLAPDEIARVALGFAVDRDLALELKRLVGTDIAFLVSGKNGRRISISTMEREEVGSGVLESLGSKPVVASIGKKDYLVSAANLSQNDGSLSIALLKPMSEVNAAYRELAWNLILIIGATLLAAMIAGIYLGRVATRPVLELAAGARRITGGDYSSHVSARGGYELAHLADAFNAMQKGIADREAQLRHGALHDDATDLPNRRQAEEWLAAQLARKSASPDTAIVLIAITNLQEISAGFGFEIADRLISHLAQQLAQWSGVDRMVARTESSRFAVLATGTLSGNSSALAESILRAALVPLEIAGISLKASVVLGVAQAPRHSTHAAEALRCAEAAIEEAIQHRRSIGYFESASDHAQRRRLQLGSDLAKALASDQLYLHFQPKTRLSDRVTEGVEALVRWKHPELGQISPAEFVPVAEHTGANGLLTRWVLKQALQQLSEWHAAGLHVGVAVNLSATDVLDPGLLQYCIELLHAARVPAGALTLEITEGAFIYDSESAKKHIEMLRIAGVRFSIDDFGTGYSSLSQLRDLPVDELKIDQSFVRGLKGGATDVAVIRAIIDLGHGMGLRVVAEGVETEAQWRILADMGCDSAQGYLISPPVAARAVEPLLQRRPEGGRGDAAATASLKVLELRRRE